MSWKASAWAKEQRLGSPSAKSILMCLADYADPDGVIKGWASQSDLSASAEVSERTAREWLQRLEDWGLVERQRQQRPSGARAADWIVLRLDRVVTDGAERCRAVKNGDADESLPADSAGRTNRQPDAEPTGNQAHPTGNQFRAYKDNPPIDPPLPSQQERAGAREREVINTDSQENDPKRVERWLKRTHPSWPSFVTDSDHKALKAATGLTEAERQAAADRMADYVASASATGRTLICTFGVYLAEKRWEKLPAKVPEPFNEYAPPFGPVWGGWVWGHLLTAEGEAEKGWPLVAGLFRRAAQKQGAKFAEHLHRRASLMEAVPVGSELFDAWQKTHARHGWPWIPDTGDQPVVYFPKGGPDGLKDFEAAINNEANGNDGGGREAAE